MTNIIDYTDITTGVRWIPNGEYGLESIDFDSMPEWKSKRFHDFSDAQHFMRELEEKQIGFIAYVHGRDLENGGEEWYVSMRRLRVPRS